MGDDNLRDYSVAVKEGSSEEHVVITEFSEYSSGRMWMEKG